MQYKKVQNFVYVSGRKLPLLEDYRLSMYDYFPENTILLDPSIYPSRQIALSTNVADKGVTLPKLLPNAHYHAFTLDNVTGEYKPALREYVCAYVMNLPSNTTPEMLGRFFERYDMVEKANVFPAKRSVCNGRGWVILHNRANLQRIPRVLEFSSGHIIFVELSDRSPERFPCDYARTNVSQDDDQITLNYRDRTSSKFLVEHNKKREGAKNVNTHEHMAIHSNINSSNLATRQTINANDDAPIHFDAATSNTPLPVNVDPQHYAVDSNVCSVSSYSYSNQMIGCDITNNTPENDENAATKINSYAGNINKPVKSFNDFGKCTFESDNINGNALPSAFPLQDHNLSETRSLTVINEPYKINMPESIDNFEPHVEEVSFIVNNAPSNCYLPHTDENIVSTYNDNDNYKNNINNKNNNSNNNNNDNSNVQYKIPRYTDSYVASPFHNVNNNNEFVTTSTNCELAVAHYSRSPLTSEIAAGETALLPSSPPLPIEELSSPIESISNNNINDHNHEHNVSDSFNVNTQNTTSTTTTVMPLSSSSAQPTQFSTPTPQWLMNNTPHSATLPMYNHEHDNSTPPYSALFNNVQLPLPLPAIQEFAAFAPTVSEFNPENHYTHMNDWNMKQKPFEPSLQSLSSLQQQQQQEQQQQYEYQYEQPFAIPTPITSVNVGNAVPISQLPSPPSAFGMEVTPAATATTTTLITAQSLLTSVPPRYEPIAPYVTNSEYKHSHRHANMHHKRPSRRIEQMSNSMVQPMLTAPLPRSSSLHKSHRNGFDKNGLSRFTVPAPRSGLSHNVINEHFERQPANLKYYNVNKSNNRYSSNNNNEINTNHKSKNKRIHSKSKTAEISYSRHTQQIHSIKTESADEGNECKNVNGVINDSEEEDDDDHEVVVAKQICVNENCKSSTLKNIKVEERENTKEECVVESMSCAQGNTDERVDAINQFTSPEMITNNVKCKESCNILTVNNTLSPFESSSSESSSSLLSSSFNKVKEVNDALSEESSKSPETNLALSQSTSLLSPSATTRTTTTTTTSKTPSVTKDNNKNRSMMTAIENANNSSMLDNYACYFVSHHTSNEMRKIWHSSLFYPSSLLVMQINRILREKREKQETLSSCEIRLLFISMYYEPELFGIATICQSINAEDEEFNFITGHPLPITWLAHHLHLNMTLLTRRVAGSSLLFKLKNGATVRPELANTILGVTLKSSKRSLNNKNHSHQRIRERQIESPSHKKEKELPQFLETNIVNQESTTNNENDKNNVDNAKCDISGGITSTTGTSYIERYTECNNECTKEEIKIISERVDHNESFLHHVGKDEEIDDNKKMQYEGSDITNTAFQCEVAVTNEFKQTITAEELIINNTCSDDICKEQKEVNIECHDNKTVKHTDVILKDFSELHISENTNNVECQESESFTNSEVKNEKEECNKPISEQNAVVE